MFYGIRRVLCIVYYTKTFSFVILWCQSNNSNSNMQSWEFLPSFISFLFALFLCSIMLQGNMAANVCVNTHQCSTPCSILLSHSNVWFAISRSRKTTWFIVFDWCMIGVSCLWRMINLFQHGCDESSKAQFLFDYFLSFKYLHFNHKLD